MAKFDNELIKYLTQLSRIDCTEQEQKLLQSNLESIISYFDQLNEIETESVPPCNHVIENMQSVMRDDIPGETLPREIFLANAPAHIGGMIRVPPVFKQS